MNNPLFSEDIVDNIIIKENIDPYINDAGIDAWQHAEALHFQRKRLIGRKFMTPLNSNTTKCMLNEQH